jgi:hypothetical protein
LRQLELRDPYNPGGKHFQALTELFEQFELIVVVIDETANVLAQRAHIIFKPLVLFIYLNKVFLVLVSTRTTLFGNEL